MSAQIAYPVIDLAETGRRIERQRRQSGLTVRDLQAYFGFEYPQAIYKWQHGECLPTVDNLLALARILRVSMEDLLVYEDQEVFPFSREVFPVSLREPETERRFAAFFLGNRIWNVIDYRYQRKTIRQQKNAVYICRKFLKP